MNKLRNIKIRREKKKGMNDDEKELLKLADKYPTNTKMQNFKLLMLRKNGLLPDDSQGIDTYPDLDSSNDGQSSTDYKRSSSQQIASFGNQQNAKSTKDLQMVKDGLKMCKGESGIFNPKMIFNCLNDIQKKDDPKAYVPEIEQNI